jgi:hypothetical protein
MPKRTIWLTAGVALGAGSTLWAERRVRRAIEQAAAKLAPDALVAEVGRTARHVAESTGDRFRHAYSEGRNEMQLREEQLWSDLANRGMASPAHGPPASAAASGGMTKGRSTATPNPTPIPAQTETRTRTPAPTPMPTLGRSGTTIESETPQGDADLASPTETAPSKPDDTTRAVRRRIAKRGAKSPSHLGN